MAEMKCYVALDLLPAYLEHVVSEETERDLKAHIAECAGCRKSLQAMQAELAVDLEPVDAVHIDYLKKIRARMTQKSLFGLCALLLTVLFTGIAGSSGSFFSSSEFIFMLYAVLPFLIFSSYFLLEDYLNLGRGKGTGFVAVFSGACVLNLVMCGIFGLMYRWIMSAQYPVWMKEARVGIYLNAMICLFQLFNAGFAIAGILLGIRKSYRYFYLLILSLSGVAVLLAMRSFLFGLDDPAYFTLLPGRLLVLFMEGLVCMAVYFAVHKWKQKKYQA